MKYQLAYGKGKLAVDLENSLNVQVIEPRFVKGLVDPGEKILSALRNPISSKPLRESVNADMKVGIIFSDITRATPHKTILPAVLSELIDIPASQIIFFGALGTHRPNTDEELRSMLGNRIVDQYKIVQNNSFDQSTQVCLGKTSFGHDIWINRELAECDLKILTGFIEPHFFAGFSGGGKAIMPGMAGNGTIWGNHGAEMIAHPRASWGITKGNPIWEEIQEVAASAGNLFLVNVAMNNDKEVTGFFAGNVREAHLAGCEFVKQTAMVPVKEPVDVVITCNSGYPLDMNLYQTVKGMSAASRIVKKGGTIIIVAECCDGIPDHGMYKKLLRESSSPEKLLEKISVKGFLEQDQWQAQIQAQILLDHDIFLYSDGLTEDQIKHTHLLQCKSIEDTVKKLLQKYGSDMDICIMPEGPQTIPYIQ